MYTLLYITSNHTQQKQYSFTDFLCRDVACNVSDPCRFDYRDVAHYVSTGDSPRFAVLPQYTEPTEPYIYYLLKPFFLQLFTKPKIGVIRPNGYYNVKFAAKAGGLPLAERCSFNNKYLSFNNFIN